MAIFSLVSDNGETFLNDLVVHFVCTDFTLEMKRCKIRAMLCFSLFSCLTITIQPFNHGNLTQIVFTKNIKYSKENC